MDNRLILQSLEEFPARLLTNCEIHENEIRTERFDLLVGLRNEVRRRDVEPPILKEFAEQLQEDRVAVHRENMLTLTLCLLIV